MSVRNMASLSHKVSMESAASNTMSLGGSLNGDTPELSNPPSPGRPDGTKPEISLGATGRTPSHSLLSSSPNSATSNRKSRFADAGTVGGNVGRASLSMPPPATKPSSIYRPATARLPSNLINATGAGEAGLGMDASKDAEASSDSGAMAELQRTASLPGFHDGGSSEPQSPSKSAESGLKPPVLGMNKPGDRLSLSSLFSLGSAIYDKATGISSAPPSAASSNAGSVKSAILDQPIPTPLSPPFGGSTKSEAISTATTATDPISVIANSQPLHQGMTPLKHSKDGPASLPNVTAKPLDSWNSGPISRPSAPRRSRSKSKTSRQPSGSTVASSAASPTNSDRFKPPIGRVGVCALDIKARSKASRNILTRLQGAGEFDVIIFSDKVILDEEVENWPICDFLISFFSDGFPLDKAISYNNLRKPFCINDLPMQKILWDRRICLRILDSMGVPTPKRLEVNRDGGPTLESKRLAEHVHSFSGVKLEVSEDGTGGGMRVPRKVELVDDGDTLVVDGMALRKPFVEKPISGENHNIHIYFPKDQNGGGGRRLFRKIGNKSSEWDENLTIPRSLTESGSSYLYEQFLHVDKAEDIKAYTVGPDYCHAETRTSPVVDGLVRRNTHGKEIRYICNLSPEEKVIARKVANGFGQRICGFDMLRVSNRSYVIDVNGWSFVKDNKDYYDQCASILKQMFIAEKQKRDGVHAPAVEIVRESPAEERHYEENRADHGVFHRKGTHGHRSAFKNLMKSPSMSKLQKARHPHSITDEYSATTPISSPPTFENEQGLILPSHPAVSIAQLPSAASSAHQLNGDLPQISPSGEQSAATSVPQPAAKHSWKLKGMVSVIRHADRTPKQKFKFTFHTQPFIELLKGHQEEVLLKGEAALNSVMDAVKIAMKQKIEDPDKLQLLRTSLARKGAWTGTKVQIKPIFGKKRPEKIPELNGDTQDGFTVEPPLVSAQTPVEPEEAQSPLSRPQTRSNSVTGTTLSRYSAAENDLVFEKLQLIVKWGGEPTHAARYQSQDLGENMRADLLLMNKEVLDDVHIFTSSERRVSTSAQIWASSFLNQNEVPESSIVVRKDLLDDSNAAKDVMDKVKKKLKLLLREGHKPDPQFAWPPNTPEPSAVVQKVAELMRFHRKVMRYNFKKLNGGAAASLSAINTGEKGEGGSASAMEGALAQAQTVASIQARWCCGEDPELFKERWEKLFSEFCDSEKVDPSKISELYDTMKFDALHNRQFLEWVFTPSSSMPQDEEPRNISFATEVPSGIKHSSSSHSLLKQDRKTSTSEKLNDKESEKTNPNLAHRIGLRRKSIMTPSSPRSEPVKESQQESYFKLYAGTGGTIKAKLNARLSNLRSLYKLAKVLFDFVCPQEYGISNAEKLEIGLLTSLPLLKEIVNDLEEVQASDDAKSFIYFTKESHIYTLLNCILEGGIVTKIARNAIPELDYLSHITFELYESEDKDADTFTYSIRIAITPGCHTFDPLDVQLDSKHSIGCAPRRSLTAHQDWKEVIETLRGKFGTVKLPKSFLAINVSEGHANDGGSVEGKEKELDEKAGDEATGEGRERKKVNAVGEIEDARFVGGEDEAFVSLKSDGGDLVKDAHISGG